jgi:hypothetical protein
MELRELYLKVFEATLVLLGIYFTLLHGEGIKLIQKSL